MTRLRAAFLIFAALPALAANKRSGEPPPPVSAPSPAAPSRLQAVAAPLAPAAAGAAAVKASAAPAPLAAGAIAAARAENDAPVAAAAAEESVGAGLAWRFDKASRSDVIRALGYDPAAEPGVRLSDPLKATSDVRRVAPLGRPSRVVKIAPHRVVENELFIRGVIGTFGVFGSKLGSPRAVAYPRLLRDPVLVMEDVKARDSRKQSPHLPLDQKAALAALALTFGLHDLNPGAAVDVAWGRSSLVDFERARDEIAMPTSGLGLMERPWISPVHLNDYEDYRPTVDAWLSEFSRQDTQARLAELLNGAGVAPSRAERDLALFKRNAAKLEAVLRRDLELANASFLAEAKRQGLSGREALAASRINREALRSPEGGDLRDVLRFALGGLAGGSFHVRLREVAGAAAYLGPERRQALAQAASAGRLTSYEGQPISAARALAAFDLLSALLRPGQDGGKRRAAHPAGARAVP